MIFERQYMNFQDPASRSFNGLKWLLIVNAGAFTLQCILAIFSKPDIHYPGENNIWILLTKLTTDAVLHGQIWRLLTYSLAHGGFLHFALNMLMLFVFGRTVQQQLGGLRLVVLYIGGVFMGSLLWLGFNLGLDGTVVGASAGVSAIALAFCLLFYNQRMTLLLFFFLPATLTGKHLLMFFLGIEIFGLIFGELLNVAALRSGVAHSAHLGGILGGFIIYRNSELLERLLDGIKKPRILTPKWARKQNKSQTEELPFTLNLSNKRDVRKEVDRILDKISEKGFDSLTKEEQQVLNQAKDMLRR